MSSLVRCKYSNFLSAINFHGLLETDQFQLIHSSLDINFLEFVTMNYIACFYFCLTEE